MSFDRGGTRDGRCASLAPEVGVASDCRALGVSRATFYRRHKPTPGCQQPKPKRPGFGRDTPLPCSQSVRNRIRFRLPLWQPLRSSRSTKRLGCSGGTPVLIRFSYRDSTQGWMIGRPQNTKLQKGRGRNVPQRNESGASL